jgi:hypothetical protein
MMDYVPLVIFAWASIGLGIGFTGWSVEARRLRFLGKVAFVLGVTVCWPLALLPWPLWRG